MKKSSNPEETLRKGSMPAASSYCKGEGKHDGPHTMTKGESNLETLRQSNRPKVEAVTHASHNAAHLAKARKFNVRSENGGAEPTAVAGK